MILYSSVTQFFFIDVDIYILCAAMNEQWEVGVTAQGVG